MIRGMGISAMRVRLACMDTMKEILYFMKPIVDEYEVSVNVEGGGNHAAMNIKGELFASMKPGAVFINTGRGRQVNEADLISVLEKRPDLTALLDVTFPEPPEDGSKLYNMPNVRLSPHIAGPLKDELYRMSDYMVEEFIRFANGEEAVHEVKPSMLLTSK